MITRRRPWVAALLALLAPGLGHLYALRPRRALAALVLTIAAAAAMAELAVAIPWKPWNVLLGVGGAIAIVVAVIVDAALSARSTRAGLRPWYDRWYVYVVSIVAITVLVRVPIEALRNGRVEAFRVPSGSMQPTLAAGDLVFARKARPAAAELRHQEIVIFESVTDPGLKVVSRVVGLPGDTLAMAKGELERNGAVVREPYARVADPDESETPALRMEMARWQAGHRTRNAAGETPDLNDWGPIVVPPDAVFTMGDNRNESYDGRYWGFVPVESIYARPTTVYFSYDPFASTAVPALFAIRWHRIGVKPR